MKGRYILSANSNYSLISFCLHKACKQTASVQSRVQIDCPTTAHATGSSLTAQCLFCSMHPLLQMNGWMRLLSQLTCMDVKEMDMICKVVHNSTVWCGMASNAPLLGILNCCQAQGNGESSELPLKADLPTIPAWPI